MRDNEITIPDQPRITQGMSFGTLSQNAEAAMDKAYTIFGKDLRGQRAGLDWKASIFDEKYECRPGSADLVLTRKEKRIVDAQEVGLAAYVTYSGYSDPYEKITYSNGFGKSDFPSTYGGNKMNYIETQYRDADGNLKSEYAIDIDNDGKVGPGEIFDSKSFLEYKQKHQM